MEECVEKYTLSNHLKICRFNTNKYLLNIFFVTFLRNAGLYLFFTVLKLYQQTKANALIEEREILRSSGIIVLWPLRGMPISININMVSYFSHRRNITFIHNKLGKVISIYSTLSNIQEYLGEYCLRINKENVITFTNIISYSEKSVIVKGGNSDNNISLVYSKNDTQRILQTLRLNVPDLEEKKVILANKTQNGGVKDDKIYTVGGLNDEILEEIRNNPCISVIKLAEIFEKKTSSRTLERRLKELKNADKIEYKGSDKTGGYYIV